MQDRFSKDLVKVGNKFKGLIDNSILEIVKVWTENKTEYVTVRCLNRKKTQQEFSTTSVDWFTTLLFEPINE